jgi:hypothetical protein
MGSYQRAVLIVLAVGVAVMAVLVAGATGAGPGGWDHLGDGGAPATRSLDGAVRALNVDKPGVLLVGGAFTNAGGIADADRIAAWNGSAWSALGPSGLNGDVMAIAYDAGKIYAGGNFTNAGGDASADYLAVWDGGSWQPFCNPAVAPPAFGGTVHALQVIGSKLYVGGTFQNGAGIAAADYLLQCDLITGASSPLVANDGDSTGSVYALTADSNGVLYAGGTFTNMAGIPQADFVAAWDGSWHAMGSGAGPGLGALNQIVRSVTAKGTDVYVGSDARNIAVITQADHVSKWNGSEWSAMGSDTSGANGWFPATTSINGMTTFGSHVFAIGSFQNANGDPRADAVAFFDGSAWHPVGSNGAGDGPLNSSGHVLAVFGVQLYAGGSFTSAGGDPLAQYAASFSLSQIIAFPTPTVTPGPPPVPTPTPTPSPTPTPAPAAPQFVSLALSQTTFAAFPSGPSVRAARTLGTVISYRLTRAAIVSFRVQRASAGRRVAGRCVAPTRANATKPSSTRYRKQRGGVRHTGKAGPNKLLFAGRLAGRKLRPCRYRMVSTAKDAAGIRSRPVRRLFRIIR